MSRREGEAPAALVAAAFEAAAGSVPWDGVVREITSWLGGVAGSLQIRVFAPELSLTAVISGVEDAFVRSYAAHYFQIDATWPRIDALRPGETIALREIVSASDFVKTEIYNDWIRPQRLFDLLGVVLLRDPSRAVSYATFGPANRPFDARARARLAALVPHLSRAVALYLRLRDGDAARAALETAAQLGVASLRVDARWNVLHVGPGSAELLDSGDAPFRVRAGRLEVGAGLAREDLQNAVSRALGGGSARLTVRRDGRQFDLIVSPSPGAPSRAAEIVALCTATGARAFDELPPFLRTTARLLTEGYPDKEIASRTGKSLATTRTYVTRVLCRLGVTSRRALIVSSRRN